MFNLVLKGRKGQFDARGTYDPEKKKFIVKKGSLVSSTISHSEKFRGGDGIQKKRETTTKDGRTIVDVEFKSPSTAANYVTGSSTNGMVAWKDKNGVPLKSLIG